MAFFEAIPAMLETLGDAAQTAGVFPTAINAWSNQTMQYNQFLHSNYQQMQSFGQQRFMQDQFLNHQMDLQNNQLSSAETISANNLESQRELQQNALDFQLTARNDTFGFQADMANNMFGHQQQMQQNQFQQQSDLQLNQFGQQDKLIQSQFKNNLATGAISSAFNLTGNLISSGINYLTTSALLNQQASLQRQNFDYTTNKAADAYTAAGLPSWLAYSGGSGMSQLPRQTQSISGNNLYTSSLPGNQSSVIWTGSSSQMAFGTGDIPSAQ